MKTKLNYLSKLIILSLMFASAVFSQNITNTLGTGGIFTIKDPSTNFLTLSQSTGEVNILNSLRLENTTSSNIGVIYKGTDRFLHNFGSDNTNIFLGINSGNFSMQGVENVGVGYVSLYSNTTGGSGNTAVGAHSLYSNTGGGNTALGGGALYFNTNGILNTAVGLGSLANNTTGNSNTAVGLGSLDNNTIGSNNTAIGNGAQVPDGTLSNQVRIGNTSVTYAGVQVAWTITSDRRWKSNILSSNLGLNFIAKLRPVSYTRNTDEKQKTEFGFIAQEIEDVLKESGVDNSGMITIDDKGKYELRYNDLLAPMVKAIQELKAENDELKNENVELRQGMELLKALNQKFVKLEQAMSELKNQSHIVKTSIVK